MLAGRVEAVSRNEAHALGKPTRSAITLVAGIGVEGDVHAGATVQHRSRVARDPATPNLRQIHLIPAELLDRLRTQGFVIGPGEMGENVTTRGLDLLALPTGTQLGLGGTAVVELTGLRNPCRQLDGLAPGLMAAVLGRDESGALTRLAGVMGVVVGGGAVAPGDPIAVVLPDAPRRPLEPV
jgi:MOSC domain-containing protein YiiM